MTNSFNDNNAPKGRVSIVRLLPIGVLILGLGAFFALGLDRYVSIETLRDNRETLTAWVERNGLWAGLVFAGIYAVVVAFSLPGGALMTITSGFLFGLVFGTVWAVLGAVTGATALFIAVKFGIGEALRERMGGPIKRMEEGFREDAFSYLLVLRLVPLFPFFLVNLAPAFLGVSLRTYFFATLIGIIPGAFVYASVGNGVGALFDAGQDPNLGIIFQPQFLIPIVGLAVLALIPVVYRRFIQKREAS